MPVEPTDTHMAAAGQGGSAHLAGPDDGAAVVNRFRWRFGSVPAEVAAAVQRVPWDNLESCPQADHVKVGDNREIWRIALTGRTIYAKCYRSPGPVKQAIERVRGAAAQREWRALQHAAAIGIQAPQPVACAAAVTAGKGTFRALLITAAMPEGALSLEQAWRAAMDEPDPHVARRRKNVLTHALAELLARAHAGGLFHHDLHVGNVLIYRHNGSATAGMIDLHNARLLQGVAPAGVRSNLAQLNQWFARHASPSERVRFLTIYCRLLAARSPVAAASPDVYGVRSLAGYVREQARRYAARLYAKRDARIRKRNKYFTSLSLPGGWTARVALDIKHGRPYEHPLANLPDEGQWRQVLTGWVGSEIANETADSNGRFSRSGIVTTPGPADSAAAAPSASEGTLAYASGSFGRLSGQGSDESGIGAGPGSGSHIPSEGCRGRQQRGHGTRQQLMLNGVAWPVRVTVDRSRSSCPRWLERLRPGRLEHEFVMGWRCLHRELPVALPLALLRRGKRGHRESILLLEDVPEACDLATFVQYDLPKMQPHQALQARRHVTAQLGRALRRLHACGLVHEGLQAGSILLQTPGGEIGNLRIVLADVGAIATASGCPRQAAVNSLASLHASLADCPSITRTDRLRLLLAVLRDFAPGKPDFKNAWRQGRLSPQQTARPDRQVACEPAPRTAGAG